MSSAKREQKLSDIRGTLGGMVDLSKEDIDKSFVDEMVARITPTEQNVYRWYINVGGNGMLPIKFQKKTTFFWMSLHLAMRKPKSTADKMVPICVQTNGRILKCRYSFSGRQRLISVR